MHMHVLCFSVFLEEVIDLGLSGTVSFTSLAIIYVYLYMFLVNACLPKKMIRKHRYCVVCKYPSQVFGWKMCSGVGVGKLERYTMWRKDVKCERHELPRITQDVEKVWWGNNENELNLVPW